MDKKEELLELCRHYKGEETCPKKVNPAFWNYEKAWVKLTLEESPVLSSMMKEYMDYGLFDFNKSDDVPFTLRALLFNRHSQASHPDPSTFKKWYLSEYLK